MSRLILAFTGTVNAGDFLDVRIDTGNGIITLKETFVALRQGALQATAPDPDTGTNNGSSGYTEAFVLDHRDVGSTSNLFAGYEGNVVTVNMKFAHWQFLTPMGSVIGAGLVSHTIENDAIEDAKTATLTGIVSGTDPCVDAVATYNVKGGDGSYSTYLNGALVSSAQASPINVNLIRGQYALLSFTDSLGVSIASVNVKAPRKLIPNDVSVSVENLEGGAALNIDVVFISQYITPLSYSLDGITYTESNVFTGIPNGQYEVYVKDSFGCVSQKPVLVDGATSLTETVFSISPINALRFARIDSGKKNMENTLSCNELKPLTYAFSHLFTLEDVIPTQFKTNAQYKNIYAITKQGEKTALNPVQRSTNIGLQAKTNSTYFDLGGGRSGIYFGLVDNLDFTTGAFIEQLDYGFTLPEWASEVGNYVTIDGLGQLKIASIGYSEYYDAFILEFNIAYTGVPTEKIISATYNLQPYELYEFDTPMSALPDRFNVVIEVGADAKTISHTYISESIKRVEDSDKLFEIDYSDRRNKGDMVYQTGISHKLRLKGMTGYLGEQSTEGYDGDAEYYVTDNAIFKTENFVFTQLSSEMAHKLRMVVAHPLLKINGINYKLAEPPEIKADINNNFQSFSVILKSGGHTFLDSKQEIISGSVENETIGGALEASKGKSLLLWTKQQD